MGPFAITLLLLIALAGFGYLASRKLAIVARLQPEIRWDRPASRLKEVLVNGFLQSRMIRREWKPGLMHAVIFVGFMSLLVRKLQLIAIGYDESAAFPGLAGALFAGFKDAVELAVLAARGYAFIGGAIASMLSGVPRSAQIVGYQFFYWMQLLVVFAFLVILPVGEHFHIVTALPTLFFRRGRPANVVPTVDLEKAMAAGD